LKNTNKITFSQIKNYLKNNKIDSYSTISDSEYFESINSIFNADKNDLTFLVDNKSVKSINSIKAKACLVSSQNSEFIKNLTKPIIVEDPYRAFATVSNLFRNEDKSNGLISKKSNINDQTKLGKNVQIDSFVTIKENCEIGNNVIIESNCSIGPNVIIDSNTTIKSNSNISFSKLGKNCIIKSGAIIGGSGFGFDPITKMRIQHFGYVIIKDNCNIGSNTTIDRAVFESTTIEDNCFIDNLVQIAHNVLIGEGTIIAAQTGVAGSAIIGKNVIIGGQVGIAGHITIGDNVKIAAKSGVTKNIKDNSTVAGFPSIDIKKWKLMNIKLSKL
tara:strand:+ start:16979 stop:17968 length:990 start_codon:yes stop_codon:yes gene_type:complete